MKKASIVSVVGRSGSGKTTFLEKLIGELNSRGRRVGVVKHDAHRFEIDYPGKDSYRLREAGAQAVAISSKEKTALVIRNREEPVLREVVALLGDVDIVLTEGYKSADTLKIEISRAERSKELLCQPEELIAVVTDLPHEVGVPLFGLEDSVAVADLLEERFIG